MRVRARIAALERRADLSESVRACPECGGGGGPRAYRVTEHKAGERAEPQFCPRCKRQTKFVIDFDKGG